MINFFKDILNCSIKDWSKLLHQMEGNFDLTWAWGGNFNCTWTWGNFVNKVKGYLLPLLQNNNFSKCAI